MRLLGPAAILSSFALLVNACGNRPRAGDTTREITIEDILHIAQVGPPSWAPDGTRVGFEWGTGAERDFWAADVSAQSPAAPGGASVRQLSPLTGRASAVVSPDWRQIAYVSKKRIWVAPLQGGRPVAVTADEGTYTGLNWSPDSRLVAFVSERNDQDDVAVASASGGPVTDIARTERDEDSPIWSPQSDRLAFIRRFDDWTGYEIWVSAPDGSGQHPIVRETYQKGVEEFHFDGNGNWSPDGKHLVYLSSRTGYNHLWTVAVGSSGDRPSEITKGPFVDYDPSWSPAGDRIVFVSSRSGDLEDRHVWAVAASGGEPILLVGEGFCARPAWSRDGSRIAFLWSSATEPPEIVVQDSKPRSAAVRLTESRPEPSLTAGFVQPEAVNWSSRDGMTVHGVLLRPRAATGSGRPALMYFHGKGGINLKGWGGLPDYAFHQYLVAHGYAVLFVNWRVTRRGLRSRVRAGELSRLRRRRARRCRDGRWAPRPPRRGRSVAHRLLGRQLWRLHDDARDHEDARGVQRRRVAVRRVRLGDVPQTEQAQTLAHAPRRKAGSARSRSRAVESLGRYSIRRESQVAAAHSPGPRRRRRAADPGRVPVRDDEGVGQVGGLRRIRRRRSRLQARRIAARRVRACRVLPDRVQRRFTIGREALTP